jgi:hypothetical protein
LGFFSDLSSGVVDAVGSIEIDVRKIFGGATDQERKQYKELGEKLDYYAKYRPPGYTMNKAFTQKSIENITGSEGGGFFLLVIGVLVVLILSD